MWVRELKAAGICTFCVVIPHIVVAYLGAPIWVYGLLLFFGGMAYASYLQRVYYRG